MHWEMRHPKLAIASFWLRWVVGCALFIVVFPFWAITAFMLANAGIILGSTSKQPWTMEGVLSPWEKTKFLREAVRREAECKRQTPNG